MTMVQLTAEQLEEFHREIRELRTRVQASLGEEDVKHVLKIERWGRVSTVLGLATAWIAPNPLSVLLLCVGQGTRWLLMHHVSHRGYDKVPGIPSRLTSKRFAKGWRRFVDWSDWILPDAWAHEHNVLHHSHTGQERDPDLLERNTDFLRTSSLPLPLRYAAMFGLSLTWRFFYYAPKTLDVFLELGARGKPVTLAQKQRALWLRCYLPFIAHHLVLIPLLFSPLGAWAVFSVFANVLLGDLLTNLHTFIVVGPNHTGDDLYRFDGPPASRAEHYVRQVIGSVNYEVGGDVVDFAHLWLNYQIEHHLFPDIPMLRYREIQPEVKALCEKYGIPYVQENVLLRVVQLLRVSTGTASMRWWKPDLGEASDADESDVAATG